MSNQYPKDEFDRAGEDMPVGMHRPQPSKWKSVIPFLVLLVLVPLLGWGASHLLTSRGVVSQESGTAQSQSGPVQSGPAPTAPTAEPSQSGGEGAQSSQADAPQSEPSESPSAAAPVDHNVSIAVLNGTATQGYAAEQAALLNQAGFAGTSAANADGWGTTVSAVYYADPDLKTSAEEVARVLGISTVDTASDVDLGGSDVVVVLR